MDECNRLIFGLSTFSFTGSRHNINNTVDTQTELIIDVHTKNGSVWESKP